MVMSSRSTLACIPNLVFSQIVWALVVGISSSKPDFALSLTICALLRLWSDAPKVQILCVLVKVLAIVHTLLY